MSQRQAEISRERAVDRHALVCNLLKGATILFSVALVGCTGCSDQVGSDTNLNDGWSLDGSVDGPDADAHDAAPLKAEYGVMCEDEDAIDWGESNTFMEPDSVILQVPTTGACREETYNPNEEAMQLVRTWEYDEQRRPLREVIDGVPPRQRPDGDADEVIDYTYSPEGRLDSKSVDSDADGNYDKIYNYIYGEQGWLTEVKVDHDVDGYSESLRFSVQYNPNGTIARVNFRSGENADVFHTFSYNDESLLTHRRKYVVPQPEARSLDTFWYDHGLRVRRVYDSADPELRHLETRYRYNCDGQLMERRTSLPVEGGATAPMTSYSYIKYLYDEQGRLVEWQKGHSSRPDDFLHRRRYFYECGED